MVKNYGKTPKTQYDDNEMQHSLQPISNCASIQVELGLNFLEIFVDQHSKSLKDSCFKVSMSLCSCY